ncbi:hypothetical protein H8E07_04980 [bacterium]|nr:hypothetical protein [bacterium]
MTTALMRTDASLACALALITSCAFSAEDEPPELELDARVRITFTHPLPSSTHHRITGHLVSLTETLLTVEPDTDGPLLIVPRDRISRLEINHRDISPGEGAAMGVGITLGAGMVAGLLMKDDPPGMFSMSGETKGILLGILFSPLGAIAGYAEASRDQWYALPPDRIRLGLGICAGAGPGLSVSVGF